ncbi:hypothetical protein QYE76_005152 [Lolium multiflorum]|uniref:Uncharacterized protein n=1 Tax=Lolium multiflorum TaxID=4521 RepID=A0AAD8RUC7_LOLMU|nr:hypothetical protein QYE76_005152 [Lolium multiflorum]
MPPRPRLTRHNTPEASMAAQDLGNLEWERSKISPQDVNLLKKLALRKKKYALRFPSEESYPTPPMEYRVSFVDHLIRGISAPIHDFLRGLLFVPACGSWKRIFFLRRNGSHNIAYNIGGVVICVRPDVEYFDVKFPHSVQGWRKRWLYVREDCPDSLEYNIAPFDGSAKILRRRSWDAEATEEEETATEALISHIHELQNTRGQSSDLSVKDLEKLVRKISSLNKKDAIPSSCRVVPYSDTNALPQPLMQPFINLGAQFIGYRDTVEGLKESLFATDKRAEDLASKLKASEEAREKAEKDASCIEDLRKRLHEAETALSDKITQDVAREGNIASRLESLNRRFVRKMSQDFVLEKPEDDRLLDALSLLKIHPDLVRHSIFDAQAAFSRLFPYLFPKKKEPDTFAALAKSFVPQEDLGLALRQESLKIGVEGTIALVAESQQNVDWAKVGEATKLKHDKWPSLIRAAKPHSKKILAFFGYKPTPSSSSAKPEVK